MTMTKRLASRRERRARGDARQHDGRRAELSDQADHGDHPVCRRQRQRRRQPHHVRQDVEDRWASRSSSRTGPAPAATPAPALAAKAAPDGYTLVGGGSGPVAANIDALQGARLRPREGPGDDLAVRRLHHRRGGQQEAAGQFAQGTDRPRQGQSRQAELRLGRHRQLAASGRRIFRAGHRREAHPRALSQHRAVRARPDRRHGAARLPVVSERRRPARRQGRDPAGGRRRQAHRRRCRTRRPPPRPACRNTRSTAGSRCSRPPARRSRSWRSSTRK